jgi:hypothetical protein
MWAFFISAPWDAGGTIQINKPLSTAFISPSKH